MVEKIITPAPISLSNLDASHSDCSAHSPGLNCLYISNKATISYIFNPYRLPVETDEDFEFHPD